MNVYVRELSTALARAGVECDVYTRAPSADVPATVVVEPGLRVHHVPAGPLEPMAKEALPQVVDEFADNVCLMALDGLRRPTRPGSTPCTPTTGYRDSPAIASSTSSTSRWYRRFTPWPGSRRRRAPRRSRATSRIAGPRPRPPSCAARRSCSPRAPSKPPNWPISTTPIRRGSGWWRPAVDHAFFAPGYRPQARRALGLPADVPLLLFVGTDPAAQRCGRGGPGIGRRAPSTRPMPNSSSWEGRVALMGRSTWHYVEESWCRLRSCPMPCTS